MKFRTVALALALGFGLTAASEARTKHPVHKVQNRKSKARAVKPRKFRRPVGKH
jgi:hypothetical protein